MIVLALYLYLVGALVVYLYADEVSDPFKKISIPGFIAVVICWPVVLPAIVMGGISNALAKRYWRERP